MLDLAGGMKNTEPGLKLYGTSLHLKYDNITGSSSHQHFCIFPSIKTAGVVGEGTRCCLIAVDHHKKRPTDKWLLETYDEFLAFLNR